MEAGRKSHATTVAKLKKVLEADGVVFIGALDPFHEPTVAMKFGMKSPAAQDYDEVEESSEADYWVQPRRTAALRDYWKEGSGG